MLAYADDLVFFIEHRKVKSFTDIIIEEGLMWNMEINKAKSGIMLIKNHTKLK